MRALYLKHPVPANYLKNQANKMKANEFEIYFNHVQIFLFNDIDKFLNSYLIADI